MSQTKKWKVPLWTRRDGDNRCWVMQGKTAICRCFGKPKTAETNAHLIASAPKLLKACKNALGAYDALKVIGADKQLPSYGSCLEFLHKAINSAEEEVG